MGNLKTYGITKAQAKKGLKEVQESINKQFCPVLNKNCNYKCMFLYHGNIDPIYIETEDPNKPEWRIDLPECRYFKEQQANIEVNQKASLF